MAAASPSAVPATRRIQSSVRFSSTRNLQIQQVCVPFSDFTPFPPRLGIKTPPKISTPKIGTRAAPDSAIPSVVQEDQENPIKRRSYLLKCLKVLKNAAKTKKVPAKEVLSAFSEIEKAKFDPSAFLETVEETNHLGELGCLCLPQKQIEKAKFDPSAFLETLEETNHLGELGCLCLPQKQKGLESVKYFPITAIQRFDAAGKRIENGVYLGALGCLTFEGRISWKNRILAFIFERIRIKIGPLNPFEISFKGKDEREPNTKDPFFIWFYVDEEIAVARGISGGTAFWVRCKRVFT